MTMDIDGLGLDGDDRELLERLQHLRGALDAHTEERYSRINPFAENLIDWHDKGERYGSKGCVIFDSTTLIGDIDMGEDVWVGPGCLLDGSGGLTIGAHCCFATGVHVYTHDTVKWTLSGGKAPYEHAPVHIGACSFLAAQSIVVRGVTIGEHALVCANATVLDDVEDHAIVAGTPARRIGTVVIEDGEVRLEYR